MARVVATLIVMIVSFFAAPPLLPGLKVALASAPQGQPQAQADDGLSPEERMARRMPQPVRVGDLIGLPVLDFDDSTIGYVRDVVRTIDGKIQLVVPYHPWLGWVWWTRFDLNRRPVAVPIEAVVILARQLDALDMTRADFDTAPTFVAGQATPVPREQIIKIGIGRR